jgi:AmiR/NasT family two-component response regulator
LNGTVDVDGGTWNGLDAVNAVRQCLEFVETQEQVTMDIILLDLFTAPSDETEDETTNAIGNLLRVH